MTLIERCKHYRLKHIEHPSSSSVLNSHYLENEELKGIPNSFQQISGNTTRSFLIKSEPQIFNCDFHSS
jgi:hypothetical protein